MHFHTHIDRPYTDINMNTPKCSHTAHTMYTHTQECTRTHTTYTQTQIPHHTLQMHTHTNTTHTSTNTPHHTTSHHTTHTWEHTHTLHNTPLLCNCRIYQLHIYAFPNVNIDVIANFKEDPEGDQLLHDWVLESYILWYHLFHMSSHHQKPSKRHKLSFYLQRSHTISHKDVTHFAFLQRKMHASSDVGFWCNVVMTTIAMLASKRNRDHRNYQIGSKSQIFKVFIEHVFRTCHCTQDRREWWSGFWKYSLITHVVVNLEQLQSICAGSWDACAAKNNRNIKY